MNSKLLSGFVFVFWYIVGDSVQNEDLTPLGALVERREQLINGLWVHVEYVSARRRLGDLAQCGHSIRHHHRIRVGD